MNNSLVKTVQRNEVTVICNGRGCGIPELPQLLLSEPQKKSTEDDANGESNISELTDPLEIYVEKLKRRADEHVSRGNRTKRSERSDISRGNARFRESSTFKINEARHNNSDDTKTTVKQDIDNIRALDTITSGHVIKPFTIKSDFINNSSNNNFSYSFSPNKTKIEPNAEHPFKKTPRLSRSDSDYDESNFDYIQTTKHNRGKAKHYSLFKNPVYDDDNAGLYEQVLLGGTNRDYEGTTPFPIVDVDHDYDQEYEYVKLTNKDNDEIKEDDEVDNTRDSREEGTDEDRYSEETTEDNDGEEGSEGEEENEDDKQVEEVDVKKHPMVTVVYKEVDDDDDDDDNGKIQPSFQYGLNPDIQERYISKDPLAGAGATRGFNHDFQPLRGVSIGGNVVVQPTRYPIVPGFNTKEIHNIISTGQLPGQPIAPGRPNWNSTKVGIIPIEPARHARPNDLGQYLGPPPPYSPSYGVRRPVRVPSHPYGKSINKPSYRYGPMRSQNLVLRGRHPRYRSSFRGAPSLSYNVRGRNHLKLYRPVVSSRPTVFRVNVLEERTSNDEPIIVEPPGDTVAGGQLSGRADTEYSDKSGGKNFEENSFNNSESSNNNYSKRKTLPRQSKLEKSISSHSFNVNKEFELNHSKSDSPSHSESEKPNGVKRKLARSKNINRSLNANADKNIERQRDTAKSHHNANMQDVHKSVSDVNESNKRIKMKENISPLKKTLEKIELDSNKNVDVKDELSKKISKTIEQSDETPSDENSNEDSISYNNHWTLEYYYPT